MDDLLIRGAQVFDGTGAPPFAADVAVKDGRIRAVGPNLQADAAQVVDADGLSLMPGIIDSHTHFDAQITWDPFVRPSPALGVTTAVIGNCGFTIAPCKPQDRETTMRNLTQVEGMSLDVLRQGIDWGFETFPQYLAQLRRKGTAVNVAAYIGHSSVRTWVMGSEANQRAATEAEIAQMAQLVREAMQHGAVGFASSTSPAHNGEGGLPMPSRLASDGEQMALIEAMGEAGRGVYMVTKGGQMPVPFLEEMSAQSGRPVMIAALLHNSTNPTAVFKDLDAITAANGRGRKLIGQVSCCPLTMDFTLASPIRWRACSRGSRRWACRAMRSRRCCRALTSARRCAPSWRSLRCSACSTANGTRCMWSRWPRRRMPPTSSAASPRSRAAKAAMCLT